jgi:4,5-dihydroxyphthalate decarboxylase
MSKLRMSFASWNYDRIRALRDGRVSPEGIDLNFIPLQAEELFFRMARFREFDASEMSFSSYVVSLSSKDHPFVAIPAFLSRSFRHSGIFVNKNAKIRRPQDLRGKRVGIPEYQLTACVWIRGILSDEYDVPIDSPKYFIGGQEETGRREKLKLGLPRKIRVSEIGKNKTLSQMLESGEIDALYTPRAPSTLANRSNVVRLFPNYHQTEKQYFEKTGIFPIMHVVAIRKDVYRKNPWVALSLYKSLCESQRISYEELSQTNAYISMLPWLDAHVEEAKDLMGSNYWPYGLERNEKTIRTLLRYCYEQGISKRHLKPSELFVKETKESFKI